MGQGSVIDGSFRECQLVLIKPHKLILFKTDREYLKANDALLVTNPQLCTSAMVQAFAWTTVTSCELVEEEAFRTRTLFNELSRSH